MYLFLFNVLKYFALSKICECDFQLYKELQTNKFLFSKKIILCMVFVIVNEHVILFFLNIYFDTLKLSSLPNCSIKATYIISSSSIF